MRVGVTLWALSWVPYGLILGLAGAWLTLAWGFEVALGLVGIAIAGTEFGRAVKGQGGDGHRRLRGRRSSTVTPVQT